MSDLDFPAAPLASPALHSGGADLSLGYVPLTDAAPLLVAAAKGVFRAHGVSVALAPAGSWSALRDRVAVGAWDGAQMLGPMPLACHFGLGGVTADVVVTATLGRNGNMLVLGHRLMAELGEVDWPLSAAALGPVLLARRDAGRPAVLAVVFPYSSHNYLLRHWLEAAGIDPDHDVRLVVLPPSALPDALADDAIDGFCAGEPWGSRAVDLDVGRIVLGSAQIWPGHPEKVLAFSAAALARDPAPALAATAAIIAATAWLAEPGNIPEAVDILHRTALPNVPAAVIALALRGQVIRAAGEAPTALPGAILHSAAATIPDPAHAAWWLAAMRSWGHAPRGEQAATALWRPDLWQRAAAQSGLPALPAFIDHPPFFRSL